MRNVNEYMIDKYNIERLPVIVITPIKNESWILKRFLEVTSCFADCIIIADQFSEDNSIEIIKKFPKVHLIKNYNPDYDEAYRQNLLISEARKLFDGPKLLLALDADEIMTADSLNSVEWNTIFNQEPGTVICFEKPDLVFPITNCIRYTTYFKLGYIDDGAEHKGLKIHSTRIPTNPKSKFLMIESIKFMHYASTREKEYFARQRYYSVMENMKGSSSLISRLKKYSPLLHRKNASIQKTPREWFDGWQFKGFDTHSILTTDDNYFNRKFLELIAESPEKFWIDDVWYNESIFRSGLCLNIKKPPFIFNLLRRGLVGLINKLSQ